MKLISEFLKILLFFVLLICFFFQCYGNFLKFLQEKTIITDSYAEVEHPEPLPPISICSNPPYDSKYLKEEMDIQSTFFGYAKFDEVKFPINLSRHINDSNSLHQMFEKSTQLPLEISVGKENSNLQNHSEIDKSYQINSGWYGKCVTFTFKKPRKAHTSLEIKIEFASR